MGGQQRDSREHNGSRHARRRSDGHAVGQDPRSTRGNACGRQRIRRLPRDAADARNVQEEGAAGGGEKEMSMSLVTLLYLVASICFIQALKGLSNPTTARHGNWFGMAGIVLAAGNTVALIATLPARNLP